MMIAYRTRQSLRRAFSVGATIVIVLILLASCLLVWMQRFVVYTRDGAVLDFDRAAGGQTKLPNDALQLPNVTVQYGDGAYREGLSYLSGYYIAESALKDPQSVMEKLKQLPAGTPVMIDLKAYRGYFFYSTSVGAHTTGLYDITKVDELVRYLTQSDLYVIARVSALRDYVTAAENNAYGLKTAAGALYADSGNYGVGHWLDPTSASVQSYLISVVNELKNKGFDEVVLQNFRYPDTTALAFTGDRQEALSACAEKIVAACADSDFAVGFCTDDASAFTPPTNCRLYLENIAAEDAQSAWEQTGIQEKRQYLVFIAPNLDTRYDIENGILRPLT